MSLPNELIAIWAFTVLMAVLLVGSWWATRDQRP